MLDSRENNIITIKKKEKSHANTASCSQARTTTPTSAGTAIATKTKSMKKWAALVGLQRKILATSRLINKRLKRENPNSKEITTNGLKNQTMEASSIMIITKSLLLRPRIRV